MMMEVLKRSGLKRRKLALEIKAIEKGTGEEIETMDLNNESPKTYASPCADCKVFSVDSSIPIPSTTSVQMDILNLLS